MKRLLRIPVLLMLAASIGCNKEPITKQLEVGREKLLGAGLAIEAAENLEKAEVEETSTLEPRVLLLLAYSHALSTGDAQSQGIAERYKQERQKRLASLTDAEIKKILDLIAQRSRIQKDAMQVLIDKGTQAVPLVIDSLGKNQFANAQSDLIEILYRIGPKGLNLMTDALSAPDTPISVKRTLVQVIGKINDPSAIPALESKRKSGDAGLTMEINIALYQLGKKDYRPEIIAGLSDRDVSARRAAAKAMSEINDSPTDEIVKALKDSDPQVRMYAAQALEKFPKKQATDSLIEILKADSNEETKQAVTQALMVYGQQDFGKDLAARLIKELPAVNQPNDRLRIVHILKTDAYKQQIKDAPKDTNLIYNLWNYADKEEKNAMVKTELDRLLVELPEN